MAEEVKEVAAPVPEVVEKKEKMEKKEKKEKKSEPEPEFYIPLEEREKALEEIKPLFDSSIKKKSKKRAVAGEKTIEGGEHTGDLAHMKAETAGDQYHRYIDVHSAIGTSPIDSGPCV